MFSSTALLVFPMVKRCSAGRGGWGSEGFCDMGDRTLTASARLAQCTGLELNEVLERWSLENLGLR